MDRIKMAGVLLLDQALQQYGLIIALFWNVGAWHLQLQRLQASAMPRSAKATFL